MARTNAFITPIDSEDIYVMSERLDPDRRGKAGASAAEAADRVWYATSRRDDPPGTSHGPVRELRPTRQPV